MDYVAIPTSLATYSTQLVWVTGFLPYKQGLLLPEQLNPSPENPLLQVQVYDPFVLLHVALRLQLLAPGEEHSSISTIKI